MDSTPRRKVRYDEITTAAMALADKGGLEAVSLRGLADSLSSGTMTLYRYVSTKVDIWDLMLDRGFPNSSLAPQAARNAGVSTGGYDGNPQNTFGARLADSAGDRPAAAWPGLPCMVRASTIDVRVSGFAHAGSLEDDWGAVGLYIRFCRL